MLSDTADRFDDGYWQWAGYKLEGTEGAVMTMRAAQT